jgi:hypothetical protein
LTTDNELRALLLYRRRALAAYEAWERRQPNWPPPDLFVQPDTIRELARLLNRPSLWDDYLAWR